MFKDIYAFAGFFFLFLTLPKKEKIFMGICPECDNRVVFSATVTSLNEVRKNQEEEPDPDDGWDD